MGQICALLLSGSDIQFLGTTGSELEPEPDSKNSRISGHLEPELDIQYIPIVYKIMQPSVNGAG